MAPGRCPAAMAAVPGLREQVRLQDRLARSAARAPAAGGGARFRPHPRSQPVLDGRRRRRAAHARTTNRAKRDLIENFMVAANGVTARFLYRARLSVASGASSSSPERWSAHRRTGGAGRDDRCRPSPTLAALQQFLRARRRPRPGASSRISRWRSSSCSAAASTSPRSPAEPTPGISRSRCATIRTRRRRTAAFPDLVTQRLLKAAIDRSGASPYTPRRS